MLQLRTLHLSSQEGQPTATSAESFKKNKNKSFKPSETLKIQYLPVKSNIFTLSEFLENAEAQISTINECHLKCLPILFSLKH